VVDFKKGESYRAKIGTYNYKIHILEIIEGMIVYKYYGKHKQWWHYEIEHPYTSTRIIERIGD